MHQPWFKPDRTRKGFTSTELVVASSLLVAVMSIVSPLAVRTTRLWKDSRDQQLALSELTGEVERLTAMDALAREAAIESLQPSAALAKAAPLAKIQVETIHDDEGKRIVLTLDWNQPNLPRAPVRLVGWLDPLPLEATR